MGLKTHFYWGKKKNWEYQSVNLKFSIFGGIYLLVTSITKKSVGTLKCTKQSFGYFISEPRSFSSR